MLLPPPPVEVSLRVFREEHHEDIAVDGVGGEHDLAGLLLGPNRQ